MNFSFVHRMNFSFVLFFVNSFSLRVFAFAFCACFLLSEPWSKTLGRNAALEYTRDSPMFRKRLWAFQETLKPLEGHAVRLLDKTEAYCNVRNSIMLYSYR